MKKQIILSTVGYAGKIVISISVGTVVNRVLGTNMPVETSKVEKIIDTIGCQVLSSMICYAALNYVEGQVKTAIGQFKEGFAMGESSEGSNETESTEEA